MQTTPTQPAPAEALAEHLYSCDRYGQWAKFTRLTKGKLWSAGGGFIANLKGHLDDGSQVAIHGKPFVLRLAAVQPVPAVLSADHPLRVEVEADQAVAPLGRSSVAAGKRQSVMA